MTDTADRLAIRDLIENWALLRDARMWDRFRDGLARGRAS